MGVSGPAQEGRDDPDEPPAAPSTLLAPTMTVAPEAGIWPRLAIPDAMAQVLGRALDLLVIAGEIVQTNKVGHTRAPAFQRLVTSWQPPDQLRNL